MTTNIFQRLKRLMPDSPVLIARVVAIDEAQDISTLVLPTNEGTVPYTAGLAAGSTMTARGTTVPVGLNAFVRDGVVETRAPDATPTEIIVGTVVTPADALEFHGPIEPIFAPVGVPVTKPLAGYWSGGKPPRLYGLAGGTLPAGLALDVTGTITGTPTAAESKVVTARAYDAAANQADSNPFTVYSAVDDTLGPLILARFDTNLANAGVIGGSFTPDTGGPAVSALHPKYGAGSLLLSTPAKVASLADPRLSKVAGRAYTLSFWFYAPTGAVDGAQSIQWRGSIWDGSGGARYFGYEDVTLGANLVVSTFSDIGRRVVIDGVAGGLPINDFGVVMSVPLGEHHHYMVCFDGAGKVYQALDGVIFSGGAEKHVGASTLLTPEFVLGSPARTAGSAVPSMFLDDVLLLAGAATTTNFTPPGPL